jgi:hypothetical protein
MNLETFTTVLFLIIGAFGFYTFARIKNEDIEKEELSGESKKTNYIPLRARKEKGLIGGIGFTSVGIFLLIKLIVN